MGWGWDKVCGNGEDLPGAGWGWGQDCLPESLSNVYCRFCLKNVFEIVYVWKKIENQCGKCMVSISRSAQKVCFCSRYGVVNLFLITNKHTVFDLYNIFENHLLTAYEPL